MAQVGVWRTGLFLFGAHLEGLNLVVNEEARGNLPPAGYNYKDGVEGDTSERGNSDGAHDGCAMCAGHTVYGHVVSLLNVELLFIKGIFESLVSARNVAEVAFDPVGLCRNVKFERF